MMGSKRKHYHSYSHRPRHNQRDDSCSSPNDRKRRRLSGEADGTIRNHDSTRELLPSSETKDDDGWTTITSKSLKRRDKTKLDEQHRFGDYPALRTFHNYQGDIKLKDVRDLVLYVLADETAPKWTAVANARSIKKAVVVMVPGLDESLLRRAQTILDRRHENRVLREQDSKDNQDANDCANTGKRLGQELESTSSGDHASQAETSDRGATYAWLFSNVLKINAPGDTKMNKVHSPLRCILLSQNQDPKINAGTASEKSPITDFVHGADELREAEYPIHPAAFTSQADAEFEAERREKTGQAAKDGWVDTNVLNSQPKVNPNSKDWLTQGLKIYSLDCEMVQTSNDALSLARISLIEYPDGKVVIDKYVKPDLPITNYYTQYSGITPQILENETTTLKDIQQELLRLLTSETILLGHSLDSDFNALKLTHPFVVDTSIIFPHPRGLPLRSSLKFLANKYLKREIQTGGADGHNSVEDAKAVLDLVKLKCEKGSKYGTMEANGEPIFRRLKRNGKTSAMVEYGTPERGYGKDATYTVGCQDDEEIVKGIARAIKGDDYFDFNIPAGGADFVWGRLRALEFARGWVSGASMQHRQADKEANSDAKEAENQNEHAEKIEKLALETLQHLQTIYSALPERSLFIIFSGTGDMRPVMKLQAQQQQYRKEFKVKKWDELSVKWTDAEEQALKKACENARAGWGVCTIK